MASSAAATSLGIGAIVGIAVGGVVVIVALALLIAVLCGKLKSRTILCCIPSDSHISDGKEPTLSAAPFAGGAGADEPDGKSGVAELDAAEMGAVVVNDAELDGFKLNDAELDDNELGGAELDGFKLNDAELDDNELGGAQLDGFNLDAAELDAAEVNGAKLDEAKLGGAQLGGAQLDGFKLDDAELGGAEVNDAKLDAAELGAAQLDGFKLDDLSALVEDLHDDIHDSGDKAQKPMIIAAEVMAAHTGITTEAPTTELPKVYEVHVALKEPGGLRYISKESGNNEPKYGDDVAAWCQAFLGKTAWTNVIAYNDEFPIGFKARKGEDLDHGGHCKGVLVWNKTQLGWLIHSVPKWPSQVRPTLDAIPGGDKDPKTGVPRPGGRKYGQSFVWIQTDVSFLGSIKTHLDLMEAHKYYEGAIAKWPPPVSPAAKSKKGASPANGSEQPGESVLQKPESAIKELYSLKFCDTVSHIAKPPEQPVFPYEKTSTGERVLKNYYDLFKCLALGEGRPYAQPLRPCKVETWQCGEYEETDTVKIVPWVHWPDGTTVYYHGQDHSKWAVGDIDDWVYIGDLNCVQGNWPRGGGGLIIKDPDVVTWFKSLLTSSKMNVGVKVEAASGDVAKVKTLTEGQLLEFCQWKNLPLDSMHNEYEMRARVMDYVSGNGDGKVTTNLDAWAKDQAQHGKLDKDKLTLPQLRRFCSSVNLHWERDDKKETLIDRLKKARPPAATEP